MPLHRPVAGLSATALLGLAVLLACSEAYAFEAVISVGLRALYLQVGAGAFTSPYDSGGTPGDNAFTNTVRATIAAGAVGTGPRTMSTDSTVNNSPLDNAARCNSSAGEVYVGGFYRTHGLLTGNTATLSVSTPANLSGPGGATLPFSTISWVSGGDNNGASSIQSGTFGGTQTIASIPRNTWFENCLTFSYANNQMVPAGSYTGRATYQLYAP
ncbi:hypothetical protein WKW79_09905 [Variovorax robiniae]|uniref:Uncharacterized protein n=1 Tax=Variovorax robiniae TaxID=1836199 RepID=A0ABU8X508_9BURK